MSPISRSESVLAEVRAKYRERFAEERPGNEPEWLAQLRSEAIERFDALGFPTTRQEDWRYTNVAALAKQPLELAGPASVSDELREIVEQSRIAGLDADLIVFVNGRYQPALSEAEARASFTSLMELDATNLDALEPLLGSCAPSDDAFAALNTAFLKDAAIVLQRAGEASERAIHLLFVSTGEGISHPRALLVAEPNSQGLVIQDHVSLGESDSVTNAVTEVVVGANAAIDVVLLQRGDDRSQLFTSTRARQDRASRFAEHTVTLGGKLVRNDLATLLAGEGAECSLRGLFVGKGRRHVDNLTLVDHAVAHCSSNELYKGILGDESHGVFRGRVMVRKDAQKTDAQQQNPNLLLADSAEIDTKPQLEIYADDVKCSHGSAIGRLDPDALFYLRSRGIGEREARELLTQGFAQEIFAALPRPALAEAVRGLIFGDLEATVGVES